MSGHLLSWLEAKVGASRVRKASGAKGGEYHSPCPICGGEDRFIVFPDQEGGELCRQNGIKGTWACPRHCEIGGDALDWLTKIEGLSFPDACRELGIANLPSGGVRAYRALPDQRQRQDDFEPAVFGAPDALWVDQATKLAREAHERLLATPNVLTWLARRGLPLEAVRRYQLGYIEGESAKHPDCIFRSRKAFGLPEKVNAQGKPVRAFRIPRGVTIPVFDESGLCLRIRIRRRNIDIDKSNPKDPKYLLVPQPQRPYSAPLMLPPAGVSADIATWVIVEAELDAMAVHHACGGKVGAISILSVRVKPDAVCHAALSRAPRILVALDADQAGADAWEWWHTTYPHARFWPVPQGKDPGDAFALGVDLAEWITAGSPSLKLDRDLQAGESVLDSAADGKISRKPLPRGEGEKDPLPARPQSRALMPPRKMARWQDFPPFDAQDSLQVLAELGLRAEKVTRETGPDFVLHGQERWPADDLSELMAWMKRYGHFVHGALYGISEKEAAG